MDKKECIKCKVVKPLSEFYQRKDTGRFDTRCKECVIAISREYYIEHKDETHIKRKEYAKEYRQRAKRTPTHWYTKTYSRLKRDNKNKFNLSLPFSKEEFIKWIDKEYSERFIELFSAYVESGCDKKLNPSIDRIDDYKSYTFDNMQLITWEENNKKGSQGIKNKEACADVGRKYCSKVVIQYDENYNKVARFNSTREAGRILDINNSLIAYACRKGWKSQGYYWKYEEDIVDYI